MKTFHQIQMPPGTKLTAKDIWALRSIFQVQPIALCGAPWEYLEDLPVKETRQCQECLIIIFHKEAETTYLNN